VQQHELRRRGEQTVEDRAARSADELAQAQPRERRGDDRQREPRRAVADRESERRDVRGREQQRVLDDRGAAAEADGQCALACALVGRAVADVVDDEDRGGEGAHGDRGG